MASTNLAQNRR